MTVFKYTLPLTGKCSLSMPDGAKVLSVQNQREALTLWALVDEGAVRVQRDFMSVMTGAISPLSHLQPFIGTVQFDGGNFVVHVFENGV